jgi:hypothetical protein
VATRAERDRDRAVERLLMEADRAEESAKSMTDQAQIEKLNAAAASARTQAETMDAQHLAPAWASRTAATTTTTTTDGSTPPIATPSDGTTPPADPNAPVPAPTDPNAPAPPTTPTPTEPVPAPGGSAVPRYVYGPLVKDYAWSDGTDVPAPQPDSDAKITMFCLANTQAGVDVEIGLDPAGEDVIRPVKLHVKVLDTLPPADPAELMANTSLIGGEVVVGDGTDTYTISLVGLQSGVRMIYQSVLEFSADGETPVPAPTPTPTPAT